MSGDDEPSWSDVLPERLPDPPVVQHWRGSDPTEPPAHPLLHWARVEGGLAIDEHTTGSAFFVQRSGLIITAAHVANVEVPLVLMRLRFDEHGRGRSMEVLRVRLAPSGRPLIALHPHHDLAILCVQKPSEPPPQVALWSAQLHPGAEVLTYGFARTQVEKVPRAGESIDLRINFRPRLYEGRIDEYTAASEWLNVRGSPGYLHTAEVLGGSSGGPLFSPRHGCAVGVNACSYGRSDEVPHAAFSVSIVPLLDLPIWFLEGRTLRDLTNLPEHPVTIR